MYERKSEMVVVKQFDNKTATVASSHVDTELTDAVKCDDFLVWQHAHVSRPKTFIQSIYEKYWTN